MKFFYNVFEDKKLIGKYTAEQAAQMLGCQPATVRDYANTGQLLKYKYKFVRVDTPEKRVTSRLEHDLAGWDELRSTIIDSGYDLSRIKLTVPKED